MTGKFSDNPDYREYERLLLLLCELGRNGQNDSDEADVLRDEMDGPWYRLSPDEHDRLGGLSADLNMIGEDEVYTHIQSAERARSLAMDAAEAATNANWAGVLRLLRTRPASEPLAAVASARYRAYSQLGHWDPAVQFIQYACKLDPTNPHLRHDLLYALTQTGRAGEGMGHALEFTAVVPGDWDWAVNYVALIVETDDEGQPALEQHYRHASVQLENLLEMWSAELSNDKLAHAYIALACCREGLLDQAGARQAWQTATTFSVSDPKLRSVLDRIRSELVGDDLDDRISPSIKEYLCNAGNQRQPAVASTPDTVFQLAA